MQSTCQGAMEHPLITGDPHPLLTRVMDMLLDAVCVVDAEGRFVYVSAACERMFGYTRDEMIGRHMINLVHPDDRERTLQTAADIMLGRPMINFENRYLRKDGSVVHVMWSARWSETDRVRIAVARDVTDLKQSTRTQSAIYAILEATYTTDDMSGLYRQLHTILSGLLPADNLHVAMYEADSGTVSYPYYVDEQSGTPAAHPLARSMPVAEIILTGQAQLSRSEKGPDRLAIPLQDRHGTFGALVLDSGTERYTLEDRDLLQFLAPRIAEAISRKQAETRLYHLAWHDALTGLPNRMLFQDRFDMALRRARRDGEYLALLYIDLNGFKQINDRYGHDVGDKLLRELAGRLQQGVREADTIGRRGGDEFTILLTGIDEPGRLEAILDRINSLFSEPFHIDRHTLNISASIGTAIYPNEGSEAEQLLRHADANMYTAKRQES